MPSTHTRRLIAALAALVAGTVLAAPIHAQTLADAARRIKVGDTVYVQDRDRRTIEGRLVSLDEQGVHLTSPGAVAVPASQILRMDRLGDPLWDGALKGALIGLPMSWLSLQGCSGSTRKCFAGAEVMWTLGGVLFDWLHQGRTNVYKAPGPGSLNLTVAPMVNPRGKALMLRVTS